MMLKVRGRVDQPERLHQTLDPVQGAELPAQRGEGGQRGLAAGRSAVLQRDQAIAGRGGHLALGVRLLGPAAALSQDRFEAGAGAEG